MLLTISIPTYNRLPFLKKNIDHLYSEIVNSKYSSYIQLIILDNCSNDGTLNYLESLILDKISFKYIRNESNFGSDFNVANSYNVAVSKYVLILGDDDLLRPGSINIICDELINSNPSIVYLNTCGFIHDINEIIFPVNSNCKYFNSASDFILSVNIGLTCISSIIFNKSLKDLDAQSFVGSNLVQLELAYSIILESSNFCKLNSYLVAYKRNNSGGYNFWEVFVFKMFKIFDTYFTDKKLRNSLSLKLLLTHYPYYILRAKISNNFSNSDHIKIFDDEFISLPLYKYFLRPIFLLPSFFFILLSPLIFFSRALNAGEWRKIFVFILGRFKGNV